MPSKFTFPVGKGGFFVTFAIGDDQIDLFSREAGLGLGFRLGDLGADQTVLAKFTFVMAPLEDLFGQYQCTVDGLIRVRLADEPFTVREEIPATKPVGKVGSWKASERSATAPRRNAAITSVIGTAKTPKPCWVTFAAIGALKTSCTGAGHELSGR